MMCMAPTVLYITGCMNVYSQLLQASRDYDGCGWREDNGREVVDKITHQKFIDPTSQITRGPSTTQNPQFCLLAPFSGTQVRQTF